MAITYAPRTTDRTGEILAHGIENFSEAFGRAMLFNKKLAQEQKEKDKALQEENDKLDLHLEGLGYSKGQIASMSIGQKRGAVEKAATEITMERINRERQQWKQEQGDRTRTEGQRRAFENAQLYQRGMTPAGAEPIDMAQAMRNAGVTDPKLVETGLAMGDAMKGPWKPSVVDAGGGIQAMMTSPNSAQPVRSTGAGGPPAAPRVVGYVPGPDGKPTPLAVIQDAKGKWTVQNTAGRPISPFEQQMAIVAANKTNPGWLERLFGKSPAAEAPAAPAVPANTNAPVMIPSGWSDAPTNDAGDFYSEFLGQDQ